jgi:hypothetical protein
MKKSELRQIIKEEIQKISEDYKQNPLTNDVWRMLSQKQQQQIKDVIGELSGPFDDEDEMELMKSIAKNKSKKESKPYYVEMGISGPDVTDRYNYRVKYGYYNGIPLKGEYGTDETEFPYGSNWPKKKINDLVARTQIKTK